MPIVESEACRLLGKTSRQHPRAQWPRAPIAAAAIVTAAAHIPVTGEHLHVALYIGVLFLALEIASVVLAVLAFVRPTRSVFAVVAIVGGLAILALLVSRTLGLPLIGDDVGNWTEPLAVVSLIAELVMAVGGALAASKLADGRAHRRSGFALGAAILLIGLTATAIAAAAEQSDDAMPGMDMGLPTHVQPN